MSRKTHAYRATKASDGSQTPRGDYKEHLLTCGAIEPFARVSRVVVTRRRWKVTLSNHKKITQSVIKITSKQRKFAMEFTMWILLSGRSLRKEMIA